MSEQKPPSGDQETLDRWLRDEVRMILFKNFRRALDDVLKTTMETFEVRGVSRREMIVMMLEEFRRALNEFQVKENIIPPEVV